MGHNHQHSEGNLKIAFFLNLFFTLIEIAGGLYTNSLAILSDALHDLGDSFSLGLSWYFQRISKKGRSKKFTYGLKRFSLLGAIINSIVLTVGSIFILTEAIPALSDPGEKNPEGMLYLSILGIVVNGAAVFKLRKGSSINEQVVSLHLLEDVLGWIAVLIGSIVMIYFDAPYIDPVLSIGISLFVLYNVVKNMRKSMVVILQGTPPQIDIDALKTKLGRMKQIVEIHDSNAWSLDGEYNIVTMHVVVDQNYTIQELESLKQLILNELSEDKISHLTIEFEHKGANCKLEGNF